MSKDFKIGEIVWTKLRGHPWWPSRIEDEDTIPENVLQQKPRNGNSIPVMFFGSRDYAWVSNESIKSFEDHKKDFIKKKNTALFDKAVQQAMNPLILEKEIARERAEYEEEEEEEIEEEEEEEEEEKPKKSNKRNKRSGKTESSRKRRKEEPSKSKNAQDDSKEIKDEIIDKKIGDTESTGASEHSLDSSDLHKKKEHKHKRHGSPSNYIYLKTRARIQKLLTADFNDNNVRQKASDLLNEADKIPMTLDILKDTKIGKVVKKFSQIEIKNDDLNLTKRATDLLIKWKSVVVPNHKNSKLVENSHNESSEQIEATENEISTVSKLSENDESGSGDNDNRDKKPTPMELSEENTIEKSDNDKIKTDKDNKEKEITSEKVEENAKINIDKKE